MKAQSARAFTPDEIYTLENPERKHQTVSLEVKEMATEKTDSGDFATFSGYVAVFYNEDSYGDIIVPGAFKESLASSRKVKLLWQHDMEYPIGSFTKMEEDEKGLYVQGRINLGTEKGREAYALMKAGDVDGLSIGYFARRWSYDEEKGIRYLMDVELFEASVVTFPANEIATITDVKSKISECETVRDAEKLLQTLGMSRKEAKQMIACIKELPSLRDANESGGVHKNQDSRDADSGESLKACLSNIEAMKALLDT